MENVIEIESLSKYYRNVVGEKYFKALDSVSLRVKAGEIYGLLGPNGSGKTTLLKLLLGLIFPTNGKALVLGQSPRDIRHKKRIGYLPEHPYFQDFLNPLELLQFYGSLFNIDRRILKKRISYLLDRVNLEKFKKMRIRNFSKGMLQRIGLAVSLINDPDLIFLDEPTLGLDPIGTLEISKFLNELNRQGKTIFLSSHLLSQVQDSCARIAIIYHGRLIKEGRLDEMLIARNKISIEVGVEGKVDTDKINRFAKDCGLNVLDIHNSKDSLKDLFIKLINEENRN